MQPLGKDEAPELPRVPHDPSEGPGQRAMEAEAQMTWCPSCDNGVLEKKVTRDGVPVMACPKCHYAEAIP